MSSDPENTPVGGAPKADSLEDRIAVARRSEDQRIAREHAPMRDGRSAGFQIASTMVGYPLGGFVIGLLLDRLFGTLPWISIGLMMAAFAGACVHAVRIGKNSNE